MTHSLSDKDFQAALEVCASEPVHIPGQVQPFGALVAASKDSGKIQFTSANAEHFLGHKAEDLLGMDLLSVVGRKVWHALSNAAAAKRFQSASTYLGVHDLRGTDLSVSGFESDGQYVLEFEDPGEPDVGPTESLRILNTLTNHIQHCESREALLEQTLDVLFHLTGFDRITTYQFDRAYNGTILAERKKPGVDSWLGLRFPHWDIPAQARAIMKILPLRMIADTDISHVPLLADPSAQGPLDMTHASTRGVSPIHMQYTRNAGARATMTLSVVVEDQLWGMIAFQHRSPKVLPPRIREILKTFLPIFVGKFTSLQQSDMLKRIQRLDRGLLERDESEDGIDQGLPALAPAVLSVTEGQGITSVNGAKSTSTGLRPGQAVMDRLLQDIQASDADVMAIDGLKERYPDLAHDLQGCAGVLMAQVSPSRMICIFREEITQSIHWAGNPAKTMDPDTSGTGLAPRNSFASYLETVTDRCQIWSEDDIYFIRHIRTLLHAAERQTLLDTLNRQQGLMIDELNHRVRNLLSLVRSVSQQARRRHGSLESYADAVESRIHALADSHDLSANFDHKAVAMRSLILRALAPYQSQDEERVQIEGPDVLIQAPVTPILSLVIHELTTNAAKYGALSRPTGSVRVQMENGPSQLRIQWTERGGPPVTPPKERGFGTELIEHAVPHELGGTAELRFDPGGVRALLNVPQIHLDGFDKAQDFAAPSVQTPDGRSEHPASSLDLALVLEDNFVIAKETADQLRDFGFASVESFSNTRDFLDFLSGARPQCAILDINLGHGQTSEPVALRLQEMGVPFFFVSGYADKVDLDARLRNVPCLVKPLEVGRLEDMLSLLLL